MKFNLCLDTNNVSLQLPETVFPVVGGAKMIGMQWIIFIPQLAIIVFIQK